MRRGLGRGLDALIKGTLIEKQTGETVTMVAIHAIRPNPFQPRQRFREEDLNALAESIRLHGMLQPVVVRPRGDGYELVVGERRWRAAQKAGLTEIPAIVRPCSDEEVLALALMENLQREDLNPLEEAQAYQTLMERFGLSQGTIASYVGKSRPTITNTLRLLGLPKAVRKALWDGVISEGHARALLSVTDEGLMMEIFERVVKHHLSVRQTEDLVRRLSKTQRRKKSPPDPHLFALQKILEERLQAPVRIRSGRKGGVVEIRYQNTEELNTLVQKLVGEVEL